MKLTLMIEGSAAALASILASLPDGVSVGNPAMSATPPVPTNTAPFSPMPTVAPAPGPDDDNGPVNTAAPAVDSRGLPWDERIHAGSKATIADGSWRKRKGVDDATVAAVEAELRSRMAPPMPAPAPMPIPPMPMTAPGAPAPLPPVPAAAPFVPPAPAAMVFPAPGAIPAPEIAPPAPAPILMPAPVPPMPEVAPVAAAPAPVAASMDFAQFMQHLSGKMAERGPDGTPLIHADYLAQITAEIATAFNTPLNALTDIAANPQMITYVAQLLARDGRW